MSIPKEQLASKFSMSSRVETEGRKNAESASFLPEEFWQKKMTGSTLQLITQFKRDIPECVEQIVTDRMEKMREYFAKLHGSYLATQVGDQGQAFDDLSQGNRSYISINPRYLSHPYLESEDREAISREITQVFNRYLVILRRIYTLTLAKNSQEEPLKRSQKENLATAISLFKLKLEDLENVGQRWGLLEDLKLLKKRVEESNENS